VSFDNDETVFLESGAELFDELRLVLCIAIGEGTDIDASGPFVVL